MQKTTQAPPQPAPESTRTLCARAISALGRDLRDTFPVGECGGQDRVAGDIFNRATASILTLLALTEKLKPQRKRRRVVGQHRTTATAREALQDAREG